MVLSLRRPRRASLFSSPCCSGSCRVPHASRRSPRRIPHRGTLASAPARIFPRVLIPECLSLSPQGAIAGGSRKKIRTHDPQRIVVVPRSSNAERRHDLRGTLADLKSKGREGGDKFSSWIWTLRHRRRRGRGQDPINKYTARTSSNLVHVL